MGDFNVAVAFVLGNEGGFSDDPKDSGGATNFGISLRLLRSLSVETLRRCSIFKAPDQLGVDDVRELTPDQAKLVYRYVFWEEARFADISSQDCCNYIFDMGVLHGVAQGVKIAQRASWAVLGHFQAMDIVDDGLMGDHTLAVINRFWSDKYFAESYQAALMAERAGYVRLICELYPQKKEFLNGWLNRCYKW